MKWITLTLTAVLLSLQYQLWLHKGGLHQQYAHISQQAQVLTQQNQLLRHSNNILKAEVEDLKNGYEAISEMARNNLGYIQDGEIFYQMP